MFFSLMIIMSNTIITLPTGKKETVHLSATIERTPDNKKKAYCKFASSMTTNVNTLTPTMITWNDEIYNAGCFKRISDTEIKVNQSGFYYINLTANFSTNMRGTFRVALRIVINGKNTAASSALGFITSRNNEPKQWSNTLGEFFDLEKDDVISVSAYRLEDDGNVYILPGQTFLSIVQQ